MSVGKRRFPEGWAMTPPHPAARPLAEFMPDPTGPRGMAMRMPLAVPAGRGAACGMAAAVARRAVGAQCPRPCTR